MLDEGQRQRTQRVCLDTSREVDAAHLRSEGSGQGSQGKLGQLNTPRSKGLTPPERTLEHKESPAVSGSQTGVGAA